MTDNELIQSSREIIAASEFGKISLHELVHELCVKHDCFGAIDGEKIAGLAITTDEYPMISESRRIYTYTESAPIFEDMAGV